MTVQLVPISPFSEEFGRIEYELQLQLNAPRLLVSECYDLSSPRITSEFQSFCRSNPSFKTAQNVVDVFVNTSEIHQLVSDIFSNGIKVDPNRGFRFRVGSFQINDRSKDVIEVIRLQVALGVTLNFQSIITNNNNNNDNNDNNSSDSSKKDNEKDNRNDNNELSIDGYINGIFTDDQPNVSNLKSGYNSLCVSENHDFVIFNSNQIKTCNLVKFKGGSSLDPFKDEENLCDLCGTEIATMWCVNDSAKLCQKCDESSHSINKILSKHKRTNLADARALMEFCPNHPDERVEYFCPVCQDPVCIVCKMSGSHSQSERMTHPLVPLRVAYMEAIETVKKSDQQVNKKIEEIEELINKNNQKMKRIIQNAKEVEEEILRLANNAIEQSKSIVGEKALLIRSAQTELERKKEELLQHAKFLKDSKNSPLGPLSFLRTFNRNQKISQSDLFRSDDLQPEVRADADLCVFGALEVSSTSSSSNKTQLNPNNSSTKTRSINSNNYNEEFSNNNDNYNNSYNKSVNYSPKKNEIRENEKDKNSMINNSSNMSTMMTMINRSKLPDYASLVEIAKRKDQKIKEKGLELKFQPFQGSSIIDHPSICCELYLCFPFRSLPRTHLLFSSERDGRSITKMHQLIDGIGISTILVRNESNGYVFGGFAAAKWNSDGRPFGEKSSSFLFSIQNDAFIPYRPQVKDACYLFATKESLTFGMYDLVLADNFDRCSAVIENSYGIGLQQGSVEAQCFMAGEAEFVADVVEVWGFFTTESD